MHSAQPSPLARDDTLLGVCQSIGDDFGFNPIYLRISLGVLLLWNPVAVVGGYAVAGAIVALSRLIFPDPAFARASAGEPAAGQAPPASDNDADPEALAAAA